MTWTHNALAEDLAARLRGASDRLFWTDRQPGSSGSPRPGAHPVPRPFARFRPAAYECKIGMADFRRGAAAGKFTSDLRFAAPAGLLKQDDVRAGRRLIVCGIDGLRSAKGPTLENMENPPRDARGKPILDGTALLANPADARVRADLRSEWKIERALREKLDCLVADALSGRLDAERRLQCATDQLNEAKEERNPILSRSRERTQRHATQIDEARARLASALGLRADAGAMQIAQACHEAARFLNADREIQRLRALLDCVRAARALELLQPSGNPFLDLCMVRGGLPPHKRQFCTDYLKRSRLTGYAIGTIDAGFFIESWRGVCARENEARRRLPHYEWRRGHDALFRPVLRRNVADMFEAHAAAGIVPNPLYREGMSRVGRMPCINAQKAESREIAGRFREHVERIAAWERLVSEVCRPPRPASFFQVGTARHMEQAATVLQVVDWSKATRGGRQHDLLAGAEPSTACSFAYGLCE